MNIEAGAVVAAVPIIINASGRVIKFALGAICAPMSPPSNTKIGAAVARVPKQWCGERDTRAYKYQIG